MADVAHDTIGRDFNPGSITARLARASYARLSSAGRMPDTNRARYVTAASDVAADRVASVDALRGFAMFWIITGDAFAWALHDMAAGKQGFLSAAVQFVSDQFKHAPWEAFAFTICSFRSSCSLSVYPSSSRCHG